MEINPKMVDGEPMCSGEDCSSFKSETFGVRFTVTVWHCMNSPRSEINPGNICIPGIRKQRDEARVLFCKCSSEYLNHKNGPDYYTKEQEATCRKWDCFKGEDK